MDLNWLFHTIRLWCTLKIIAFAVQNYQGSYYFEVKLISLDKSPKIIPKKLGTQRYSKFLQALNSPHVSVTKMCSAGRVANCCATAAVCCKSCELFTHWGSLGSWKIPMKNPQILLWGKKPWVESVLFPASLEN